MDNNEIRIFPFNLGKDLQSDDIEGIEDGRNLLQYKLFFLVGTSFIALFGLINLLKDRIPVAIFLCGCLALTMLVHLYVKKTRNIAVASWYFTTILFCLMIYLVMTGGVGQTGPIWTYPIVILVMSLLGHRHGLIANLTLIGVFTILMFSAPLTPYLVNYSVEFQSRFLATLTALTLLSWAIEYSRGIAFGQLHLLSKELDRVSRTDHLTGLQNRRGALEQLNAELNRYQRNNSGFSILLIDIDNFKRINDRWGHTAGDCILKKISRLMAEQLRDMDVVARWGGEEFLILLPDTLVDDSMKVAENIRASIELAGFHCTDSGNHTTVSIGVSAAIPDRDIFSLIDIADAALYRAKQSGKNRVVNGMEANNYHPDDDHESEKLFVL
jgi:diguanylate cyclase (GGDEF)-like protein